MRKSVKRAIGIAMSFVIAVSGVCFEKKEVKADSFTFKCISLSCNHSAAVTQNGKLFCWGQNENGQLGDGTTEDRNTPVCVLEHVEKVALGWYHSAAITENGDLYCWGKNASGQLGDGTKDDKYTPVKVLSGVKDIAMGAHHSAAITENGDLYCWGSNDIYGEVGVGNADKDIYTPEKILSDVKKVSLGYRHSAAITENGDLYFWGDDHYADFGDGTPHSSWTPRLIMSGIKDVSLGDDFSAIVKENGDLYLWGRNFNNQIGIGDTWKDVKSPVKVLDGVVKVELGRSHSAALKENGDLYLWGQNNAEQLGSPLYTDEIGVPTKRVSGVKDMSLGGDHSGAIKENGDIVLWGGNKYGQIGNGLNDTQSRPVVISIENSEPEEELPDVSVGILGSQINPISEGFRTVYYVDNYDLRTVEAGLVYGLEGYVTEEDMVVGSSSRDVYSYKATTKGRTYYDYGAPESAATFVMTMTYGNMSDAFLSQGVCVRAYVKLEDGTYIYSDINTESVYTIADKLYKRKMMKSLEQHNYLYNRILKVVQPDYKEIDFEWSDIV